MPVPRRKRLDKDNLRFLVIEAGLLIYAASLYLVGRALGAVEPLAPIDDVHDD